MAKDYLSYSIRTIKWCACATRIQYILRYFLYNFIILPERRCFNLMRIISRSLLGFGAKGLHFSAFIYGMLNHSVKLCITS